MSLVHEFCGGYMLDHETYVSDVYRGVSCENGRITNCRHVPGLFAITQPFKLTTVGKRKRKLQIEDDCLNKEVLLVKNSLHVLLESLKVKEKCLNTTEGAEDIDAKELSKKIFESTKLDFGTVQGGNNSSTPLRCQIRNELYLIPPMCSFMCGDVTERVGRLADVKFDLLVADPPWWNKYIRRLKTANPTLSYSMMYNEDIASIPVARLLADNCLVAVWCTNSPSNISAVKELIFPAWRVSYVATWYWLKVTKSLEPVCTFGTACMKQPFERLILGTTGNVKNIPDKQLIVSVPSALHSHKPPLIDVLSQYVDGQVEGGVRTLELFARYLLPGTTSIGFEPLKWQHISLYGEDEPS